MHVFVTGATGWVGSAIVQELMDAGHHVTGLARSREKSAALAARGATVLCTTLDDLDALRSVASTADAVIHTAFDHDFAKFAASCEQDRRVIDALGSVLAGSARPLLVTSGLLGLPRGACENDLPDSSSPRRSEFAARGCRERGVRAATVRLAPSVHGRDDWGFVPILRRIARETGVSGYIGEGTNAWSAVHREDAARVYRLALEQGAADPVYHAVAEEKIPFLAIAKAIGDQSGLPVEPRGSEHFGWLSRFVAADLCASSAETRRSLRWTPRGPALLAELQESHPHRAP